MRIVIDLQGAQNRSRFRGIGRYSLAISKAIATNRRSHEVIIVLNGQFPETIESIKNEFKSILPTQNIIVWDSPGPASYLNGTHYFRRITAQILRESFLYSLKPDVVLVSTMVEGSADNSITSIGTFSANINTAVILYDLIPLIYKEDYLNVPSVKKWYMEKINYLKKADLFLSISESSKQEGMKYLGLDEKKVKNISAAISENFKVTNVSHETKNAVEKKFLLSKPYIMYCGAADPRKNLKKLIEAYGQLPKLLQEKYQLLIAGGMSDDEKKFLKIHANSLNFCENSVLFTGHITDSEMISLYSNCDCFVLPSYHEGFGLPVLEAMACGAPVIGSNISSIPEVIGIEDALFDPFSVDEIANKIEMTLVDNDFRKILIKNGEKRLSLFSWDRSASMAIDAFEQGNFKVHTNETLTKEEVYKETLRQITQICRSINYFEKDLIDISIAIENNLETLNTFNGTQWLDEPQKWRIEGPFDSSYSLALLNRETARALEKIGHFVVLHSTEGPGDFKPNQVFLETNSDLNKMNQRVKSFPHESVDVVSRNLYPPRVNDMNGPLNMLHHYAWEESGMPREWVADFNTYLDGITCLSSHVEKILIDNGVQKPLCVSGCGVDHWERIIPDASFEIDAKNFRFLHVSSCFPRKGIDLLLEAYFENFTDDDDVSLIIKTFSNPHNDIHTKLREKKANNSNNSPHVLVIEEDLSESSLKALYEKCHVLVAPSCAEGFGLPLAEAMLSNLSVITTRWGGQLDFCNDDTSYLLDFEFEKADTHFELFSSIWAKANVLDLAKVMLEVTKKSPAQLAQKAKSGSKVLLDSFTWEATVKKYIKAASNFKNIFNIHYEAKIGVLSTWNEKCGIAVYSSHLLINEWFEKLCVLAPVDRVLLEEDLGNCIRCWNLGKEANDFGEVHNVIESQSLNTIIIQFNYSFYNHRELSQLITALHEKGCIVIVAMHSTTDPIGLKPDWNFKLEEIQESLKLCDRILVHSIPDLNRLKEINLINNVTLFPLGVPEFDDPNTEVFSENNKIIATYGFCLPHKGLSELIEAVSLLIKQGVNLKLRLVNAKYPVEESQDVLNELKIKVAELQLENIVEFYNDYLDDSESIRLLREAELVVFPYQLTGESSSGAVRYGMATNRPVAVTPLPVFDDMGEAVFRFSGISPVEMASDIDTILTDLTKNSLKAQTIRKNASRWKENHGFNALAKRLLGVCNSLLINKNNYKTNLQ